MLVSVLVIVGYVAIGMVAYWPVFPEISHKLFSVETDYTQSVWFLALIPSAIAHGNNPFVSNALLVPHGVNLAQNTASPLLGLLTAPLTPVLNAVARANLLMVLGMPLSAAAAFIVLRAWQVWIPAAALGGLMYGFSPYMVGQATGHVDLIFVPVPPLIAWTVWCMVQRRGSARRLGIQLGLLMVGQYLISPEILAIVCIFTLVALLLVTIRARGNLVALVRTLARPTGVAFAVVVVLLAYPVWMMVAGPQHFTGQTWPTANPFHNDVLSAVAPGPLQRVSMGLRSVGTRLVGASNATEAGGYIGIPVLVLAGFLAWRSRRRPRTQLTVALLFVALVCSLGPRLSIDGHLSGIPLPFALLDHIPLLDNILPSRISVATDAFVAAVVAFGIDDLYRAPARHRHSATRTGNARIRRGVVLVTITLVVLVATQLPQWPQHGTYAKVPVDTLPTSLRTAVPAGDPVAITYPYATAFSTEPMLWQVEDGFGFRLLGGYAYHPGPNGHPTLSPARMDPPELQEFLAGQGDVPGYGPAEPLSPELVAATRRTLTDYDVRLVIVDRSAAGSGPVMELFTGALGPPTSSSGALSWWTNRHAPLGS